MKKILFCLLLFIVSPVFAQNAMPFCTGASTQIHVNTKLGNPKYVTNLSRRQFLQRAGGKASPYTLGLTVSQLQLSGSAKPRIEQNGKQICVSIAELNIDIGFPELTVYIDKKYMPSSCEYKIIRLHENYHVSVGQQAMLFFKPDIEKALSDAISSTPPEIVYSADDIHASVGRQFDSILRKLDPLMAHINEKIREKNAAIDTQESYEATRAKCNNW